MFDSCILVILDTPWASRNKCFCVVSSNIRIFFLVIAQIISSFVLQVISLVMVSIGVYARMMKEAGKCAVESPKYPFISSVLLQSVQNLRVKVQK